MALSKKDMQKYFVFGGIAGLITPWLLSFISQLVSAIPGVNLELQSISASATGLGTVVNTGLSDFVKKAFGVIPLDFTAAGWFFIFIGAGLSLVAGAWIADKLDLLKGDKQRQITSVLIIASIITGWILSLSVNIPAFTAILSLVISAWLLSFILVGTLKALGQEKLIP